jgi:hypothetical protein
MNDLEIPVRPPEEQAKLPGKTAGRFGNAVPGVAKKCPGTGTIPSGMGIIPYGMETIL